MPHDPRIIPGSVEQSLADRVKALERRVAVLERARPPVYFGTDEPTADMARGSLYWQYGVGRLWVRGPSSWRYIETTASP